MDQKKLFGALALATVATMGGKAMAGAIGSGDIVVYQVGANDTSTALTSSGTAVFVDDFNTSGTLQQQIALPTTTAGNQNALVGSGSASSEGLLTVSPNGQYIAITGYDAAVGTAGLSSSASATTARTVGIINATTGSVDTSTALTDFATANNPRSAITTNGTDIWVTGAAGGVRSTTIGSSTSTQVTGSSALANFEELQIANGQLYASSQKGTTFSIGTIGTGLPTTSGTATETNLTGLLAADKNDYSFTLVALPSGSTSVNELYVAEGGTSGSNVPSILKYTLTSGTWTAAGSIALPTDADGDAITGISSTILSNGTVELYATDTTSLFDFNDTTGSGAASGTAAILATAAGDSQFRGVGIVPAAVPEPASVSLLLIGGAGLLARRRRRA